MDASLVRALGCFDYLVGSKAFVRVIAQSVHLRT